MYFISLARRKSLPTTDCFPDSALIFLRFTPFSKPPYNQVPMERFTKLFGKLLLFVYHCFDRIVINGYLSGLSRPEQVVHFFRQVIAVPIVSKEVLSQRTNDYQDWVEAFASNHQISIQWAPQGIRQ